MTIIQDFQALQTGEQIGLALAVASIILIALHWAWAEFTAWCDRQPIYDPLVHGPEDQLLMANLHGVGSEYEADQIVGKHVSQRASSQLIGGLLQLDEEPSPEWSRPAPVRYTFEEHKRCCEETIQRYMAADTIKGKRP